MGWFIPALIAGASALAGGLSNRKSKAEQSQHSTSESTTDQTQAVDTYSMPQYTEEMASLRDLILNTLRNRMISSTDLSGYQTTGLQNINQGSEARRKVFENLMAARGLSSSPATANAIGRIESGRIGEQINFLNQIPLLQRQLQGEDIQQFGDFFSRLPVGSHNFGTTHLTGKTTGTQDMTGTATQPGNVLGGLFTGLAGGLATTLGAKWAQQNGIPSTYKSNNSSIWVPKNGIPW